jgi:Putative esterase
MRKTRRVLVGWLCNLLISTAVIVNAAHATSGGPRFEISFPASTRSQSLTGRIYVVISQSPTPVDELQHSYLDTPEFLGVDSKGLKPGAPVVIDGSTLGYPLRTLSSMVEGDYYVQAFVNIFTDYPRADGRVIWALDQWNGQQFSQSTGNLRSLVRKVHLSGSIASVVKLSLSEIVSAGPSPTDTQWEKHVKIKSEMLSRFWGRPIYLGAEVLLPRDYDAHPDVKYPVIYDPRDHYLRDGPFHFTTNKVSETEEERQKREDLGYETGYQFYRAWNADGFPRLIAASLILYTPYYDFSGSMNSAFNGPYQDAIMQELIPYLETHFRVIREPYARVLMGKSSGARDALALQLYHPEFFNGAWMFYPWSFAYHHYFGFDIYDNKSAFIVDPAETQGMRSRSVWLGPLERYLPQTTDEKPVFTMREYGLHDAVLGGPSGVGEEWRSDDAVNGPIGADGYPKPLYSRLTGDIDHEVADYWREHGDLTEYARSNWNRIGTNLVGKLHFYVGDMDEWYRNLSVREFQSFLESTKSPYYSGSFNYGPAKGHGWQPMTNAELVKIMADRVAHSAPQGESTPWAQ